MEPRSYVSITVQLHNKSNTNNSTRHTKVLPPANGKKLWRVKRSVSAGSASHSSHNNDTHDTTQLDSSLECMNNSLRISAAANKFSMRRPPLRRPKNKPGKPKDFVFVDLSPVKNGDSEVSTEEDGTTASPTFPNNQLPSPTLSVDENAIAAALSTTTPKNQIFDIPQLNDSFSSISSDDDSIFSAFDNSSSLESAINAYMQATPQSVSTISVPRAAPLDSYGLGIMNLGVRNWEQNPMFKQPQQQQQQQPQQQTQQQQQQSQALTEQLFGYQQAMLQQYQQIQLLQQQLQQHQHQQLHLQQQQQVQLQQQVQHTPTIIPTPITSPREANDIEARIPNTNKRSKSASETSSSKRRASGQFQFKTYTGPNKSKQQIRHRHTASEPTKKYTITTVQNSASSTEVSIPTTPEQEHQTSKSAGLEAFMMLNEQISIDLQQEDLSTDESTSLNSGKFESYTPVSDYSDEDDYFTKSKDLDSNLFADCGIDQFLLQKPTDEFEFSGFVSV
ncbi:uncharacterized protein RJT20DRAFT_4357 [Scheffersomyces xylosifermentans]|uniref:uncharacterized protein n=1 Tax=Scheffersomyces xylosifermentans TaxID=1304137 RepID=UPI00315D1CDB